MDMLLSILTGGATGLLGTVVSGVAGFFKAKQRHEQELELRKVDLEMMELEMRYAADAAVKQAESDRTLAELASLEASYREASSRLSTADDGFMMAMLDFVRGMTRPALTATLVGLTAWIYFDSMSLREQIVNTVLYLTTAAVLWWFGSRATDKALGGGTLR